MPGCRWPHTCRAVLQDPMAVWMPDTASPSMQANPPRGRRGPRVWPSTSWGVAIQPSKGIPAVLGGHQVGQHPRYWRIAPRMDKRRHEEGRLTALPPHAGLFPAYAGDARNGGVERSDVPQFKYDACGAHFPSQKIFALLSLSHRVLPVWCTTHLWVTSSSPAAGRLGSQGEPTTHRATGRGWMSIPVGTFACVQVFAV